MYTSQGQGYVGRNDRYVPIAEKRFERRFWPENLEDISNVGSRFLTVTPPFDEELLDYTSQTTFLNTVPRMDGRPRTFSEPGVISIKSDQPISSTVIHWVIERELVRRHQLYPSIFVGRSHDRIEMTLLRVGREEERRDERLYVPMAHLTSPAPHRHRQWG